MPAFLQIVGLVAALMVAPPARGADVAALLADRSLGNPAAPVTIVEYSSLTCPHCASFHLETLPQIKSAYIDPGKVRFIYRDYPLDPRALAAAMVARCVEPARYFGFLDVLYRDQQTWARSADPIRDLKVRAQLAALSPQAVDACLADQELARGIEAIARQASREHGIDSTPSFVVNGRLLRGAHAFADFRAAIEAALLAKPDPASAPAPAPAEPPAVDAEAGFFGRIKGVLRRWLDRA